MTNLMLVLVPLMALLSSGSTVIATGKELSRISVDEFGSFVDEFGRVRIFRGFNDISNSLYNRCSYSTITAMQNR